MPKQINLSVITQEKKLLESKVDQVTAPGVMGEVTIMPGHVPLFTRLSDGLLEMKTGDDVSHFAVMGGFMDVGPGNRVTIMADSAIRSDDINVAKAKQARKEAKRAMENKQSQAEFKQAEASLRRAILELKVARRLKIQQSQTTANQEE